MESESTTFRKIGERMAESHFDLAEQGIETSFSIDSGHALHLTTAALDGRRIWILEVRDQAGALVAYSYTSSLEDLGRDMDEFSQDYFATNEWSGPIQAFIGSEDDPR